MWQFAGPVVIATAQRVGLLSRLAASQATADEVAAEQREQFMGTMFAINMRSFGDTYTEGRIRGWLEAAGLVDVARTDLSALRWLIAGRRP